MGHDAYRTTHSIQCSSSLSKHDLPSVTSQQPGNVPHVTPLFCSTQSYILVWHFLSSTFFLFYSTFSFCIQVMGGKAEVVCRYKQAALPPTHIYCLRQLLQLVSWMDQSQSWEKLECPKKYSMCFGFHQSLRSSLF